MFTKGDTESHTDKACFVSGKTPQFVLIFRRVYKYLFPKYLKMFQRFLVWIAKLSGIKTLKRTLSVDQLKENINKA